MLSVPDGRSVSTLVNATPIHSEDGKVESVVVAIQDLAPLEELERQRAEFLGLVSHELRAPLTSIKGSTTTVLAASPELADLPVIFISGYRRDETVARALQLGAADYIVKPFSPIELTARVQAALRRRAEPWPFVSGDLSVDYDQRQVSVAGRPVELTGTEYELLRVLSLNAGRVTTFDTLLRQVWGRRGGGEPTYIFNERGIGYRMAKPGNP